MAHLDAHSGDLFTVVSMALVQLPLSRSTTYLWTAVVTTKDNDVESRHDVNSKEQEKMSVKESQDSKTEL